MKTIVTHFNPDLDAVASVWLLKKFFPEFIHAEVQFVPAGKTWRDIDVDSDSTILHVDTGRGLLDHHKEDSNTCSARLVIEFLKKKGIEADEALERLVDIVNEVDHFREVYWPDATSDRYEFCLESMLDGWKLLYQGQDLRFIDWGLDCLDGIYRNLQNKVLAEREIETIGRKFQTRFGKAIAVETMNDDVLHIAQKMGFVIAVRLDPKKHYLRVKALPPHQERKTIDLSSTYKKFKQLDPEATWYLHPDHRQLLNGSTKSPDMRPTKLTLEEIMKVLEKI